MGKVKSLILSVNVDHAKRAHNCQANSRHRIQKGDKRLNVRNGRSWDRYCWDCSQKMIEFGQAKLFDLKDELGNL